VIINTARRRSRAAIKSGRHPAGPIKPDSKPSGMEQAADPIARLSDDSDYFI
jgi:hypothetical protein